MAMLRLSLKELVPQLNNATIEKEKIDKSENETLNKVKYLYMVPLFVDLTISFP